MALALSPQSPIAIVAMVSASTLYRGQHPDRVRWAINAVIIGGVLTEIVVRLLERSYAGSPLETPLPVTSGAAAREEGGEAARDSGGSDA